VRSRGVSWAAGRLATFFCLLALAVVPLPAWSAPGEPTETPVPSRLGLTKAVLQALRANLDLAARQRALEADREQVDIERSALLPQIEIGARAQLIDSERPDSDRGFSSERSASVLGGLSQVIYDENDWASYEIQRHLYDGQSQQLIEFRLEVVQDAAESFLNLDRSLALTQIQATNRELTRRNLEATRARVATGYSSQRELLRWQSQLASNDQALTNARTEALVDRFELNRVRNRPREEPILPKPVSIEEYGFVYARPAIAKVISKPEGDRRLRDLLVRLGITRSPVIAALDAEIAAEERLLTADKRAFWIPSLVFSAGVDHLVDNGSASNNFNLTEWGLRGTLSFPLLEGGAKVSRLRQSRDTLSSLRIERRSAVQTVGEQIRAAFARASGAYANIDFAGRQEETARRNYEFVYDAYDLGVTSILDLLDAQSQLLSGRLGSVNALYDFYEALVAAELALAYYPFLESAREVESFLDQVEIDLRSTR